jgi:archaellum biogenesis protein FlaJ (TadC family)
MSNKSAVSFISELRRRNVFKVASVYLVTSWLLLQIIAVITPALQLPAMFATISTVILGLVFPVVCILAWAFELTPEGVKLAKNVDQQDSIRHETGRKINLILVGAVVLLIVFIVYCPLPPQ